MQNNKTVGIIGFGTIARTIIARLHEMGGVDIAYVLNRSGAKENDLGLGPDIFVTDEDAIADRKVDLVVEAAMPELVARLAPRILSHSDVCAFSTTAMADERVEAAVTEAAAASGHRFYVPHGAVLALDGLVDGRDVIESVTITTTKSGRSLGLDADAEGVIYEGSSRDACKAFPRNVNVHAAVALAGLGFDRTTSRIVAVPGQAEMKHRIEVTGEGLHWNLEITSISLGGVTGSYTPKSAAGTVARILGGGGVQSI